MNDTGRNEYRIFGVSNWTHERITEANAYARSKGLEGFIVSSPNFGLAHQITDPWAAASRLPEKKTRTPGSGIRTIRCRCFMSTTNPKRLPGNVAAANHPLSREDVAFLENDE